MEYSKNSTIKQSKAIANQNNCSKLNQLIGLKDNRNYTMQAMLRSLRPRKAPQSSVPIPSGYTSHSIYKNVLFKPAGGSVVLIWSDALNNKEIITSGNRTEDLTEVPSGAPGYDWHHCELQDAIGTCLMQLVPHYQHNDISHIGAIDQFKHDPRF